MSVPSVGRWLDILEATAQILIVPPFFEDFGKRLIKAPKVYLADSGLTCHLLGIATEAELDKSPFLGVLFEGFLAAEIVKGQITAGRRRELYYFRNQQGLEVDLVVPARDGGVRLAEAQASATVTPGMAEPMLGSHAPRSLNAVGMTLANPPSAGSLFGVANLSMDSVILIYLSRPPLRELYANDARDTEDGSHPTPEKEPYTPSL